MALFYKFTLDTFQDRKIECFQIDKRLTACPLRIKAILS